MHCMWVQGNVHITTTSKTDSLLLPALRDYCGRALYARNMKAVAATLAATALKATHIPFLQDNNTLTWHVADPAGMDDRLVLVKYHGP
mmetsp:Transcript_27376/g.45929  ORF Transcript_27376/g.45929 Transcript_27376/m.45929 type:complete len:88 (-) Transcript_27376:120-383(-)